MQQKQMYVVMNKTVLALGLALLVGTSVSSAKKHRQSDVVVSVTPGSVTFSVEDVMIAKQPLPDMDGEDLALNWLEWSERDSYLGASFADKTLVDGGDNPFFSMVCLAYAHHRPIILTPDAMWILICHGFSQYVNHEPDKFRDYLVSHQGKETLLIRTSPGTTSEQKVEKFASLIGKETKGDLAEVMTCNFSTTGMVERMVSQIVMMDAVKPYFDYIEILIGCGIPSVTLEGTPDDWKLLREKTRRLGEFGVSEWTDRLDPILEQFVAASQGNPDADFWWNMAIKGRPRNFHLLEVGGGCLSPAGEPTKFDGWFLEFIPFDANWSRPQKIAYDHNLIPLMTSVPIIQYVDDGAGNCLGINALELRAGIVGLSQDNETMALRPEIGWLVRNDSSIEFDEDDVRSKVAQADLKSGDDIVIKQAIKWLDIKRGKRRRIGESLSRDIRTRGPIFIDNSQELQLSEFEGWGITLEYDEL